jgi:hypothetical protein
MDMLAGSSDVLKLARAVGLASWKLETAKWAIEEAFASVGAVKEVALRVQCRVAMEADEAVVRQRARRAGRHELRGVGRVRGGRVDKKGGEASGRVFPVKVRGLGTRAAVKAESESEDELRFQLRR